MKIIFTYPGYSSFVKKDCLILKSKYLLKTYEFKALLKWKTPFLFLKHLIFLLKNCTKDTVFLTQFAGYQSVIPTFIGKCFGVKNFIILGGTDCNWLPSIGYGNFNKPLLRWATKYSLKNATHLIPVNKELVECDYIYNDNDFKKQGYKAFIKNINTPYTVIPNGIDLELYMITNQKRIPNSFITTCSELHDERRRYVKGIDLIINIAINNPTCYFTIVGGILPHSTQIPKNINTIPFIENELLPDIYNHHEFYIQLSLTEGFPNALIEAMACGCVPIVSSVGAMPDIVQKTGYVLQKKSLSDLQSITQNALNGYKIEMTQNARKRAEDFSIKRRESLLLELIKQSITSPVINLPDTSR